jgi:CDP-diacylglycerol--serine O-phosphatidyltransferase
MNLKYFIPSLLTSTNIFLGSVAVFCAVDGKTDLAVYLVLFAAIFDFADGFFARMLNAVSDFGKQLDSLSDLISFGFAPASILYYNNTTNLNSNFLKFIPILIVIFSAIRLAKFNIDPNQKSSFKGLPTPANAIFLITLFHSDSAKLSFIETLLKSDIFIGLLIIVLSALLVLPLDFFSLKIKKLVFKENIFQIILILSGIALFIIFGLTGISFSIILYIVLSIFKSIFGKKNNNEIFSTD